MADEIKFHEILKSKMDEFVHLVYKITKNFPIDERFGIISQLRRAAVSVILNYIEGYARRRNKIYKNFLETSYGSLKESEYLLEFSEKEGFVNDSNLKRALELADEIGAMLWSTIEGIENNNL
ncbi:MAG: four helix bundle protein [Patescibacteria group bacterium]